MQIKVASGGGRDDLFSENGLEEIVSSNIIFHQVSFSLLLFICLRVPDEDIISSEVSYPLVLLSPSPISTD